MILVLKLDLNNTKMYVYAENEVLSFNSLKVMTGTINRQTQIDLTDTTIYLHT